MRRRMSTVLLGTLLALGLAALSASAAWAATGRHHPIIAISAGDRHTCALTEGGAVYCWGANEFGQLGNGKTSDSAKAVPVKGLGHGVVAIDAAAFGTCALLERGAVKCWGSNDSGQLGDGTTTERHKPVKVRGLPRDILAVSAASLHTCALDSSGTVWCWGYNQAGELGAGTPIGTSVSLPVIAVSATDIAGLSAGSWNTCAITKATAALCWGGAATLGSQTQQSTAPVEVEGLTSGVEAISSGAGQTCALANEGKVLCWGANDDGELGIEGTVYAMTPEHVSSLVGRVSAISAGNGHTCAVVEPGVPYCWGKNEDGQLGDGTRSRRTEPVLVKGLSTGVRDIGAGSGHTCAVLVDGQGRCWGHGKYGELGNGKRSNNVHPVKVKFASAPPATDTEDAVAGGSRPVPVLPLLFGLVAGVAVLIRRRPARAAVLARSGSAARQMAAVDRASADGSPSPQISSAGSPGRDPTMAASSTASARRAAWHAWPTRRAIPVRRGPPGLVLVCRAVAHGLGGPGPPLACRAPPDRPCPSAQRRARAAGPGSAMPAPPGWTSGHAGRRADRGV